MPVLSPWLPVRRLRQPRWRWSWCLVPGCSVSAAAPTSSRAARRPGEVSAPGLAVLGRCAGWLPRLWLGCGGLPGCRFPRSRSILQHTGAGASPSNTSNKLSQPPREETNPGTPYRPVAAVAAPRRESRVVPAAVPPGGRVCPGRTRAPPPPLPPASVLECAGRCGLHRGYLALPRRCALRPLPDLRSNCPLRRRRLARPFRRSAQCGRFRCKTHLPSADHTSTGRN